MSSTFSNLKFELIGNGEQSGTWGTTTNTNIGTAIEQAVVGMATLDSGDFTANVATLTLANTNAAQDARALCLNIASGAVSAAGTVNVPAIQKPYIVINGSSFTVTVKVSGQTGVAVPAGKRTVVYNNGTDVGSQINWLAALDITTLNATTVDATTVEATNIRALDGTASVTLANSTGVASFTANPVMSGGTANGVAYLNGSKVLTTGSALTFDGAILGVNGVSIGRGAGAVSSNTAVGASALAANTSGNNNVGIGNQALQLNTTGNSNVMVGSVAGYNSSGAFNVGVGYQAVRNASGNHNVGVGGSALVATTSGGFNTAVGSDALQANTTASNNTALGYQAGFGNTTGTGLTAVGMRALYQNTTGGGNVAVGGQWDGFSNATLYANTTGAYNTAVGVGAAANNTTGSYNTALGYQALVSSTTTSNNTAVGYQALLNIATANSVAVGSLAGKLTTTGGGLVAIGYAALTSNTTGVSNTAVGTSYNVGAALQNNTTGGFNVAVGEGSLYSNTTASGNTAVGYQAGYSNTASGNSVYVGYQAGYGSTGAQNVGVGSNIPGFYNAPLYSTTGSGNTAIGPGAGGGITSGSTNIAIGSTAMANGPVTGSTNIAIGWGAGISLTSGSSNTFVGAGRAGFSNGAGNAMTTGSGNLILGNFSGNQGGLDIRTSSNKIVLSDGEGNPRIYNDGTTTTLQTSGEVGLTLSGSGAYSSTITLGAGGGGAGQVKSVQALYCFAGNQGTNGVYLLNGSSTSWTSTSDERLKTDLKPIENAAQKVSTLRAVTGRFKTDDENVSRAFLIAQDVLAVLPEAVSVATSPSADNNEEFLGVQYTEVIPLLVAAIKELKAEIDQLKGA